LTEYFDTLTQLIMVKIRLTRTGPRKKPFYRVVAIDERKKNGGQPLEVIGYYLPKRAEKKINKDRLQHWTNKGAKVTPAVSKLL